MVLATDNHGKPIPGDWVRSDMKSDILVTPHYVGLSDKVDSSELMKPAPDKTPELAKKFKKGMAEAHKEFDKSPLYKGLVGITMAPAAVALSTASPAIQALSKLATTTLPTYFFTPAGTLTSEAANLMIGTAGWELANEAANLATSYATNGKYNNWTEKLDDAATNGMVGYTYGDTGRDLIYGLGVPAGTARILSSTGKYIPTITKFAKTGITKIAGPDGTYKIIYGDPEIKLSVDNLDGELSFNDPKLLNIYKTYNWKKYLNDKKYIKSNDLVLRDIQDYKNTESYFSKKIDPNLRFKFFEPKNLFDLDNLEDWEVSLYYGPEAKRLKQAYDITKRAGNTEAAEKIKKRILGKFAINKADPDVVKGLQDTYDLYKIPEYRQRFDRFGTLGDTFITDATNRLDNVLLQGVTSPIRSKHGITGFGGALLNNPSHGFIYLRNSDNSELLREFTRHEAGHISHGILFLPTWMKWHNEKIRPIPKPDKVRNNYSEYLEDMDEIVTRAKTAVGYADKHRLPGETLDDALDRIANEIAEGDNIYNLKYPSDMRLQISHFELKSIKNFWKHFVGGVVLPLVTTKMLLNNVNKTKRGTQF